jgi:hypothetical protein
MIRAGGYILPIPADRRETLLGHATPNQAVGEPVASFSLSARAPLIVFASFDDGAITHIADGRKGIASGTQMVRLNLSHLQQLAVSITHDRLLKELPAKARVPVSRRLRVGGLLSPGAFPAVVQAVTALSPDVGNRLARFSASRADALSRLSERERIALGQQKESVGTALKLAGMDSRQLLNWTPPADGHATSFLDGLSETRVREDAMVAHDLDQIPGFAAVRSYPFAAKVFESDGVRLTVMLANKLPLEEQFGTDLIYYNESFRSFVMVQYKAMERPRNGKAEFRLPNAQLDIEVARMISTLATLEALPGDDTRDGFRLHNNPFFLKLCARHIFNPDDGGLFPGMYLPLDYWQRLVLDDATVGSRGGRLITFENVGRKLTESEFIALVAGAWVGTTVNQSAVLEQIIRDVIESGKALTLAVRQRPRVAASPA